MKRKFSLSLSACVLLVGALGFGNSAEAAYHVVIDNYGTNGAPSWAGTSGTITIRTKINGAWATVCNVYPTGLSEAIWCMDTGDFEWDDVEAIRVQTNSSDGFWLDQIQLWSHSGPFDQDLEWSSGTDNITGWCFSTAEEDPSQNCLTIDGDQWWAAIDWVI